MRDEAVGRGPRRLSGVRIFRSRARASVSVAQLLSRTCHKRAVLPGAAAASEDGDQGEARVEHCNRVGEQPTAVVCGEGSHEEERGGVGAPTHREGDEDPADEPLQLDGDGERREQYDGQQAVSHDGGRAQHVYAARGHQVEHRPQANEADREDAVDGAKVHLALEEQQRGEGKAEEQRAGKVVVVHDLRGGGERGALGPKHDLGLLLDVLEVDAEVCWARVKRMAKGG